MNDKPYRVVDQQEDTDINAVTNRVERGFRVYYTDLSTNVSGSVFVPMSEYTADNVDKAIMHVLDRVREVHALGG